MITSLDVLDEEQSARTRQDVHALRSHWMPRGPEPASFFTLGSPSYLDLAENPGGGGYYAHARADRPVLWDRFGWLYGRLAEMLGEHLKEPVHYPENLALPGFHVWLAPAVFTKPKAPIHFDMQYRAMEWPPDADLSRLISFTLPLRLPGAGGGLNVWEATHEEFREALDKGWIDGASDLQRFHPRQHVAYTVGRLVMHSGHILHQVAPCARVEPDDERLTLQGHGVWCSGRWSLYW
ncbi:hypothetical protein [Streptosporangium subroseum]|uniref:hypothetical protein n=1 Tax=Streptosporangium subroseum TaxID=106412 RepID=UPI0030900C94|nr:hypothetical protein OHB15_45915 [Streptosporangium subroseum]